MDAVGTINNKAGQMSGATTIPFNTWAANMAAMRAAYDDGLKPVLDIGAANAVNNVVDTVIYGAPSDSYASFETIRDALVAFNQAYNALFPTLQTVAYSAAAGHAYADLTTVEIDAVRPELNAILVACNPWV